MSDNSNTIQKCCVCTNPAENRAVTPCSHPEPLCEACYQKEFSDKQRGNNNYNRVMLIVARNGNESIVRQMLDLGPDDFNRAMAGAACEGFENIVKLMLD